MAMNFVTFNQDYTHLAVGMCFEHIGNFQSDEKKGRPVVFGSSRWIPLQKSSRLEMAILLLLKCSSLPPSSL